MKIRNTFLCRVSTVALIAILTFAGTTFAAESLQPRDDVAQDAAAVQEVQAVAEAPEAQSAKDAQTEEPQIRTFGTESEDAVRFEFTNLTGKDITYFTLYINDGTDRQKEGIKVLQEALIEQGFLDDVVDGSYGPNTKAAVKAFREANDLSAEEVVDDEMLKLLIPDYDDGNILGEDEVIKADETVVIFFQEEKEEDEAENVFLSYSNFNAEFKLAEDETDYTLHTLAMEGEIMQIKTEGVIPYIEYQALNSEYYISTLETERTILYPPVVEVYENPAQDGDGCIDVDEALTW